MDWSTASPTLAVLLLAAASVAGWLAGPSLLARWRRARVRRQPFPPVWRRVLRERMPAFARLPADVQWRLKKHAQVLLAEVPFIGCGGLVVDDEVRVLVAVQASLLLLGRGDGGFAGLSQVLVYPGAFVVDRTRAQGDGTQREERQVLAGESWQQGQVVLSWQDVLDGAARPDDGRNVVIHEFARLCRRLPAHANRPPAFLVLVARLGRGGKGLKGRAHSAAVASAGGADRATGAGDSAGGARARRSSAFSFLRNHRA